MKEVSTIGKIFCLLRKVNIHPAYLLIPMVPSLIAASFEGVSIGLLIPLLNGFLQKDFSFIKETPVLGDLLTFLPPHVVASDRLLFGVLLGTFVVAVLLKNVLRYLSILGISYIANRSLHHLRKVIFTRYLSFGKLYFDRTNVGHHNAVLSEFTLNALRPVFTINKYVNVLFSLIVYLIVMSFISWKLTAFALPLFAVIHFSVQAMIEKIRLLSYSIVERGKDLGKKTVEILSIIPLVKAYATERLEQRHYATISDKKAKLDFHVRALQELILPLQEMITLFSVALLFSGMLYLMVQEQTSAAPAFIVYFYVVLNASSKFGTLTSFRGILANASGSINDVLEVFDDADKCFVRGGRREFPGLQSSIEFRDLSFSYQSEMVALRHISFSIEKGKMTAIVGPTGSGKSTLIHLIMRFYNCPPSSLFIDGVDVQEFRIESLMKHIALVSQETLLLHETLAYNILYGLEGVSEEKLMNAIERARLSKFVQQLPMGLDTLIGDRGVKLSGGEKQRVSIARAFLKGAEILILDEATSSLDSRTEKFIQEAIDDAVKGRTAIVIAHRLSTIKHADTIVVFDEGRVVEVGSLDKLLSKKGKFSEFWEEQMFY